MAVEIPAQLNTLSLEPISDNGKPPEARLKDAGRAQQIVNLLIKANEERIKLETKVKGTLDGNPPFDPAALRQAGQANRTNINFREAEGISNQATTPYYDLFANAPTYYQVTTKEGQSYEQARWSRIITQHFHDMIAEWDGFDWNMQMSIKDMVDFGKSFVTWPDKECWRFSNVRQSKVLVPDGASSNIDDLDLIIVRECWSLTQLWKKIKDEDSSTQAGWNRSAVLQAMKRAAPDNQTVQQADRYEMWQQEIRNHDLYESVRSSVVRLAHIFVKEFDGKISWLIVEEGNIATVQATDFKSNSGTDTSVKFLYKRIGYYDKMRQCLAPMFYDIGDGQWHSIKGLAVKLHPFIEVKNRLNCSLIDSAFLTQSVLLRPTTGDKFKSLPLIQLGGATVLPPNFEAVQWNVQGRMSEGLIMEQALDRKLSSNVGQYRTNIQKDGNPVTATQVQADMGKEAMLSQGAVNRFYAQLDFVGEEIYRRASNPELSDDNGGPNSKALEFQKKCEEDGVPASAIKNFQSVRAYRNIGNGSIFLRQSSIASTMALTQMMNEAGRQNWLDDAIATMAGAENVERWNPKQTQDPSIEAQQYMAVMENGIMDNGAQPLWTGTQNDIIHLTIHLKAADDAAASLSQGGDPMAIYKFAETVGAHCVRHLQALAQRGSKSPAFQQLAANHQKLAKFTDNLGKQIQAQQQQAAQQQAATQQVMSDEQLKQMQAQHKMATQQEKTDHQMQLRDRQAQQKLNINAAVTTQKMALNDATAANKMLLEQAKAVPSESNS